MAQPTHRISGTTSHQPDGTVRRPSAGARMGVFHSETVSPRKVRREDTGQVTGEMLRIAQARSNALQEGRKDASPQ